MAFAGIYEVWRAAEEDPLLRTCAVITTAADEMMRPVHDRMPVVLPADVWADWIDRETDTDTALALAHAAEDLVRHRVGDRVNSVRNKGPDLIAPVPEGDDPPVPLRLW
jgi:putative SOS response-associated peptidase YedK